MEEAADRRALGLPLNRAFAELLIDYEEDRMLRAVIVGMPREARWVFQAVENTGEHATRSELRSNYWDWRRT